MFNISDELVSVMVLSEKENDASESKKPKSLPFGGSQTIYEKMLAGMYENARRLNDSYVSRSIEKHGPRAVLLDVGCWDGVLTADYAKAAKAQKILGIEVVKEASDKAVQRGIECHALRADVDPWPFQNESIDCVVSNQVVEHLSDLDHYFSEASRVLKKGGILVTSTNNLASWHNIGALFWGWAPFDLTNSSRKSKE